MRFGLPRPPLADRRVSEVAAVLAVGPALFWVRPCPCSAAGTGLLLLAGNVPLWAELVSALPLSSSYTRPPHGRQSPPPS